MVTLKRFHAEMKKETNELQEKFEKLQKEMEIVRRPQEEKNKGNRTVIQSRGKNGKKPQKQNGGSRKKEYQT